MRNIGVVLCIVVMAALAASAQPAPPRVLVVAGASLGGVKWDKAFPWAITTRANAIPTDAQALAVQTTVLIVKPETLSPAQCTAVEAFVRGGGGLLIDGMGDRTRWTGGLLDVISPAIGHYEIKTGIVGVQRPYMSDLSLNVFPNTFPRLGTAITTATPDHTPTGFVNFLSAWYYSKPLWHDNWQEWLIAGDPAGTPLLSGARYGAGRVAITNWGPLADPESPEVYKALTRVVTWLAGDGIVLPAPLTTVAVKGYAPPEWYIKPIADGMKGMGQRTPIEDFNKPPEALQESGYLPVADVANAQAVILMGAEAEKPVDTKAVVLRAPSGATITNTPFDNAKLQVVAGTRAVSLVEGDKLTEVKLPHRMPAFAGVLPALDVPAGKPAVTLQATWRMAFTNDPDTDIDLKEGWQNPKFDDTAWREGKVGEQKTKLFGQDMGYDGAIWYRGTIEVPADAVSPNAALVLEARNVQGYLTAYVDGKQVALEPGKIVLPLTAIGAGRHLLAVRVYGELRSNTGLAVLDTAYLPLLWHDDAAGEGWGKGWYKETLAAQDWQPVSAEFSKDPVGKGPLEGWVRAAIDVPDNAVPFEVAMQLNLNVEAVVFVNGKRVGSNAPVRATLHRLPAALFHPGKNTIALWVRYADRQSHSVNFDITPAAPLVYRATVTATRDGQGLRATLVYDNMIYWRHPAVVSMVVDGQAVGGSIGQSGSTVVLYVPHALRAGDNTVEIRMSRAGVPHGLQALEAVETPAGMAALLPGWKQCPREAVKGLWADPALDDSAWEPTRSTLVQQYDKSWVVSMMPDIEQAGIVYRTHLVLAAEDLKQIQTLYLRHAAVKEIVVNGQRVMPDDEWYYSLNAALKVGDNVIAFAPDRETYRGLNMPVPDGREGHAQMPLLVSDRAPLIPATPRLAAFRLNRALPVPAQPAPAGAALFTWPNGVPAVTAIQRDGCWEASTAPGLFDNVLPAPNLTAHALVNGSSNSQHYELGVRLNTAGFAGDRTDQLLPAILNALVNKPVIADALLQGRSVSCNVVAPANFRGLLAWRILDWEGALLASGTTPVNVGQQGAGTVSIPLPDLADPRLPEGAGMGRFVRVRAALLSEDRRTPFAFLDRHWAPSGPVTVALTLDRKLSGRGEATADTADRVLHESSGQLTERWVYLPGEAVTATATLRNAGNQPKTVTVHLTARPGLTGTPVTMAKTLTLAPYGEQRLPLVLDAKATATEQPWEVTAEALDGTTPLSGLRRSLVVARPRGELQSIAQVTREARRTGGYMWQMSNHAFPLEHRWGTDAEPVPDGKDWWTRVRKGGDGNWTVAEGIHRGEGGGDQHGLLWGPFYDQTRGEIMDSYGWFPNGENIRAWWAPYAMREVLRNYGTRSVVLGMSDWWQYDAGFPPESYATLQMFNNFLVASKGQTIAGKALDGQPIRAATMREMLDVINRDYKDVYGYFVAAGLARSAEYTGQRLNAVAPGSTQWGQGAYAGTLPATVGGIALGPQWASSESQGSLDADNHPFAGDWQYGIETTTFRAIGIENNLLTHWEEPMDYHDERAVPWHMFVLPAERWQRRLLDSRWLVVGDQRGQFQRVLNTTHEEDPMADVMPKYTNANIGSGVLPFHWWIKDRLANLSMTIASAKPLSPLLLVGESRLDWTQYYGVLGKLRNAGLTLGGGISLAQLEKMKVADIPALVWPVAEKVDGRLLAAVEEKIRQGVPVLLIGHVPASIGTGPDLRALLGVRFLPDAITDDVVQVASPACAKWPEAANLTQTPGLRQGINLYEATDGGMEPLVTRNGRIMLGRKGKVVFLGMVPKGLWELDDPAVNLLAVRALEEAMTTPVTWPDGLTGYAFRGADNALYLVVENLRGAPITGAIRITMPQYAGPIRAADLLTGRSVTVQPLKIGLGVPVTVDGESGTVVKVVTGE